MKRKMVVFLLGSLLLGAGPVVAKDEEIKAAAELGKLMGAELMRKRASVCTSEALMILIGYRLKESPERLHAALNPKDRSLSDKHKELVEQGFLMEKISVDQVSEHLDACLDEQLKIIQLGKP